MLKPALFAIALIGGSSQLSAQPGQQRWLELADRHEQAIQNEAGRTYFERFTQRHAAIAPDVENRCGRAGSRSGRTFFQSVVVLDRDGQVAELLNMPDSPHLRCFEKQMRDQSYPPPPSSPYPVVVTFQLPTSN